MNYSKALRVLRAAKGVSQQDLAKRTGLSKSLISKIESGIRTVSPANKEKFAKSLSVSAHLFDILAAEPHETSISKQEFETIGKTLLHIDDEIRQLNEKTL